MSIEIKKNKFSSDNIIAMASVLVAFASFIVSVSACTLEVKQKHISENQTKIMQRQADIEANMSMIAEAEANTNLQLKILAKKQNEYIKQQTDIQTEESESKKVDFDVFATGFIVPTKNQIDDIRVKIINSINRKYVIDENIKTNRILLRFDLVNNSKVPIVLLSLKFEPRGCSETITEQNASSDILQYYAMSSDEVVEISDIIKFPKTVGGYSSLTGLASFTCDYWPSEEVSIGTLKILTNRGVFNKKYSIKTAPGTDIPSYLVMQKVLYERNKRVVDDVYKYSDELEEYSTSFNKMYEEKVEEDNRRSREASERYAKLLKDKEFSEKFWDDILEGLQKKEYQP